MKDESLYVKGIRLVFVSPLSLGSSLLNFPSYKLSRFAPQPNTYIDSFMDCNNKPPSCYDCSLARHLLLFIITLSLRMPIQITHKIAVLSIIKLSAWRQSSEGFICQDFVNESIYHWFVGASYKEQELIESKQQHEQQGGSSERSRQK